MVAFIVEEDIANILQVLQALQQKSYLLPQTVTEIEECLKERDTLQDAGISSPVHADVEMAGVSLIADSTPKLVKQSSYQRPDKKQIEQRIEEDRERHKRLRENIWAIPAAGDAEFDRLWDETSELGEDDFDLFEEESEQRKDAVRSHMEENSLHPITN